MQTIITIWNHFLAALTSFGWGTFVILLIVDIILWRINQILGMIAVVLTILFVFHLI
jgi:hypothetical protein